MVTNTVKQLCIYTQYNKEMWVYSYYVTTSFNFPGTYETLASSTVGLMCNYIYWYLEGDTMDKINITIMGILYVTKHWLYM